MGQLFIYYGLDWIAMISSLLAVALLGNHSRSGFLVFVLANTLWIFTGLVLMDSVGIAFGNLIFLILNIRGYTKWKPA